MLFFPDRHRSGIEYNKNEENVFINILRIEHIDIRNEEYKKSGNLNQSSKGGVRTLTDIDAIKNFIKFISVNSKKDAEGKIRIDPAVAHKLVADDPETAIAVVGVFCKMAENDPVKFQMARIIAAVYENEFDDDVLMLTVQHSQAKSAAGHLSHPGFNTGCG